MITRVPRTSLRVLATATGLAIVAACGTSAPASDAADVAFVRHMLPHHLRAIEVATLAEQRGGDPRVVAFGQRIVAEQTPEADRLRGWVTALHLHTAAADTEMADGYITDTELARLQAEPVAAFDHDVLVDSASSEQGAVSMAAAELATGTYQPARTLARSISGAPESEIPQLRALAG